MKDELDVYLKETCIEKIKNKSKECTECPRYALCVSSKPFPDFLYKYPDLLINFRDEVMECEDLEEFMDNISSEDNAYSGLIYPELKKMYIDRNEFLPEDAISDLSKDVNEMWKHFPGNEDIVNFFREVGFNRTFSLLRTFADQVVYKDILNYLFDKYEKFVDSIDGDEEGISDHEGIWAPSILNKEKISFSYPIYVHDVNWKKKKINNFVEFKNVFDRVSAKTWYGHQCPVDTYELHEKYVLKPATEGRIKVGMDDPHLRFDESDDFKEASYYVFDYIKLIFDDFKKYLVDKEDHTRETLMMMTDWVQLIVGGYCFLKEENDE